MVQTNTRKPFNVKFTEKELNRIKDVASRYGEGTSTFIRRQILMIVEEEESQK